MITKVKDSLDLPENMIKIHSIKEKLFLYNKYEEVMKNVK